jgi:hypothetical protein
LTYILPSLAILYVVLSALWLVPDSFAGMYGNRDGHWASWAARAILEWSGPFDFSPFSPVMGTGSTFVPNLPWLNPGALALALPVSLPVRHFASMLVYLVELSVTLYLLYRHLDFSREQSFLATLLYVSVFFIPFWGVTGALPWYSLAPVNAHLIAAMNVASIALIRVGYERLTFKLLFACVFLAALFVAFTSAAMTAMSYVPIYAALWIAFLIPLQGQYGPALWRCGAIVFALVVLGLVGAPSYVAAWAMTAARGASAPPVLHPGWRLLSPSYWQELLSALAVCRSNFQLICPLTVVGWFDIAALGGGCILALACSGVKRRYGIVIIVLIVVLHFYALLYTGMVLGRLHVISTPFLMWAFSPVAPPAVVAVVSFVAARVVGRSVASVWAPATAGCLIAIVAIVAWFEQILPYQPRTPGRGPLGLAPIAHVSVRKGPIVDYLERHIGLQPGSEFHGYVATFLGAPDGLIRKTTRLPDERMTYRAYLAAGDILFNHFGNRFQQMDLWRSGIPTIEEYGQSVSRQMHYFSRDLLADPQDELDPYERNILVYRFRPLLLRALGVRFVIADGTLSGPATEFVMTESGNDGAKVNLYEIEGANVGQFSPTEVTWAADYAAAVSFLRNQPDLARRMVLLGAPEPQMQLSSGSRARLVVLRDGYRLTASAPGLAAVVLPIQFSHCWHIKSPTAVNLPRIFRANVVQTGVLFKGDVDVRLRFDFEPWRTSCRLQDARDLALFGFK